MLMLMNLNDTALHDTYISSNFQEYFFVFKNKTGDAQ